MSVEVKKLVIKSKIVSEDPVKVTEEREELDVDMLRDVILDACKELIDEKFNDYQER